MRQHNASDTSQEQLHVGNAAPGTRPWHVPVAVDDVTEEGQRVDIAADSQVRAALARIAGLRELPRLEAHFDLTRSGAGGLSVVGHVSASVGQTCVVTLEPIVNEVEEDVELLFAPPPSAPAADRAQLKAEAAVESAASPEPLIGGIVDLGALASEFLLLGIDPYPRKPGAVFQPPSDAGPEGGGPFAALAGLKKGRDGR